MAVTNDGRAFFSSADASGDGIWSIDRPGARPRKVTQQTSASPSIPSDGRFVVYQGLQDGRLSIWRSDPEGADARVISQGKEAFTPVVSPDGRWVYYGSGIGENGIIRTAPDGSARSVLTAASDTVHGISPDGRALLAGAKAPSVDASHFILDAETGEIRARLTLPPYEWLGWGRTADVVAYIQEEAGVGNLWEQPIAGGAPRRVTNFTTGRMSNFAYSPDGKRLFLARGQRTGDVWILRDFR